MEIGKINSFLINNTVDNTGSKVNEGNFEERLKNAMDQKDEKELKKVCREFESIMLNMMYKQMKATVPKTELIPGDAGRDIFESMLDDNLIEEASRGRGMGLADIMYKQLSKKID